MMKKKNYQVPVLWFGTKVAALSFSIFYMDNNSSKDMPVSNHLLLHNFTLNSWSVTYCIVHIDENKQRLMNSFVPNIGKTSYIMRKAPTDTEKKIRFTSFFPIAKVKAVAR